MAEWLSSNLARDERHQRLVAMKVMLPEAVRRSRTGTIPPRDPDRRSVDASEHHHRVRLAITWFRLVLLFVMYLPTW